ncbi:MAG: HEAT repeat domain-containing protein [Candidatus Edwardsbacteria bacterium]|jgi:HEAT repeat protein|nr:HEAT repeat domain-containing protein [Candidatus Edwardsbacteria bacterium]
MNRRLSLFAWCCVLAAAWGCAPRHTISRRLVSDDLRIRRLAFRELEALSAETQQLAIPDLIHLLTSNNPSISEMAVDALARLGGRSLPALVAALKHRDERVRAGAAEALGAMGPAGALATGALLESLEDRAPYVRLRSAAALGAYGAAADDAVPYLAARLADEDPYVRLEAARALFRVEPEREGYLEVLLAGIVAEEMDVRYQSAEMLGEVGMTVPAAVPALARALGDRNFFVALTAAEALKSIGTEEALRALREHRQRQ